MIFLGAITVALAVLSLHFVRENARLRKLLVNDELTGALNKTGLEIEVKRMISHCIRSGESFSFLYLDLKGFKAINDQIGRHEADEILRVLAKEVQARIRAEAVFGRLSGDEFVVALPASLDELPQIIDRLLAQALKRCDVWARHHHWPAISGRVGMATLYGKVVSATWWNPNVASIQPMADETVPERDDARNIMHRMLGMAHGAMERAKD